MGKARWWPVRAAPTPSMSACAMRIPSAMPLHANRVAWSVSAGPSAMSPSLSIGARRSCRAEPGTSVSTSATDSSDGGGGGKKRSVRKVMSSTSDGAAHGVARCPEASLQQGHGVDVLVGVGVEGRLPRSRPASRRARLPAEWQGQGRQWHGQPWATGGGLDGGGTPLARKGAAMACGGAAQATRRRAATSGAGPRQAERQRAGHDNEEMG